MWLAIDGKIKYRAIVSDLDGTLLDPAGNLSDLTVETLNILHARGLEIVIATGRCDADARGIVDGLGFSPAIVSCNGAMVNIEGRPVADKRYFLPRDSQMMLMDYLFACPLHVTLFTQEGWMMAEENPHFADYIKTSGVACRYVEPEAMKRQPILKVLLQGEAALIERFYNEVSQAFGKTLSICKSSAETIDIMDKHISKARSVADYLSAKQIAMRDCLSFGDAMNDLDMLRWAGTGVVMGNAMGELKRALPFNPIALPNSRNGVADYLCREFGLF
ncbi:HAD family hydrolase [Serratia ureilytica]|uniref:HAD family hydrolase n=1 Tax=Serratia ureilytica TaxID=300181 RepID=UPI0018D3B672|nr:HAD family hydrolase [Serratia ureilytica]MBH1909402.1 HAD family hydrolase [Serratia ureilytica]